MSGYTQLTREQRYQIHALVQTGQNQTQMATGVGVHKATISRELRRNRGLRGYRPHQAHRLAQARQEPKRRPRLTPSTWHQVEGLVREAWSPEQIHGRLPREHGQTISHERMYQYIYQDKQAGGDLSRSLRGQKTRRKRYGRYSRRGQIPNQVSIDERPAVVTTRQRLGDCEGDTVIGKGHREVFVTLVERKSKYTVLEGVQHKTAAAVRKAVARGLRPHQARVQTMTYDNGREFSDHAGMAKDLKARIYFAHPYASWERGVNENTYGLIRQFFPKNRDFTHVTKYELKEVMATLNHRPRKTLGYRTPHEVFFDTTTSLTVALTS
ncbi:MAG: IS30 family transposase [Nitrospirales bacterium]|nr:MAG: IS30 family transposase [Nitrospirales bacterium]